MTRTGPLTAAPARAQDAADGITEVGGKAANLRRLQDAGLPVPRWTVIPASAFDAIVGRTGGPAAVEAPLAPFAASAAFAGADAPGLADGCAAVQRDVAAAVRPDDWEWILAPWRASFAADEAIAVRSSATVEDGDRDSFAGQFVSFLGVRGEAAVREAVLACWQAAFAPRVVAYARLRGRDPAAIRMAVLLQQVLDARVAGVLFAGDPAGGTDVVVAATYGLATTVVGGDAGCDTYRVDAVTGRVDRDVERKSHRDVLDPTGRMVREQVPEAEQATPCLSDDDVRALAGLGRRAAQVFGCPIDVEWAVDADGIWIVQARPVTAAIAPAPAPASQASSGGRPTVWDNANISESYPGVTTPLTYSFARAAYAAVYPQALAALGVPERVLAEHRAAFESMIGLVRGRMYYDLARWYEALALLPGYPLTARFMELMMGLRDPDDRDVVAAAAAARGAPEPRSHARERASAVGLGARMAREVARSPRRNRAFLAEVDRVCRELEADDLSVLGPVELVERYRELQRRLLARWLPPIVNDSVTMLWYGLLDRLAARTASDGGDPRTTYLRDDGRHAVLEPARRLEAMGRLVRDDETVARLFATHDDRALAAAVLDEGAAPALATAVREYLRDFGFRSAGELELEEPRYREDPALLFAIIRSYALRPHRTAAAAANEAGTEKVGPVPARPTGRPRVPTATSLACRIVAARTRVHVRDREELRFARARVFDLARQLFLALGDRLVEAGTLDDRRDVFLLEVDELLGYVSGTGTTVNLRGLVALRRAEFDAYRREPAPPDRVVTRGPALAWTPATAVTPDTETIAAGPALRGRGCRAGRVRGRAQIVADAATTTVEPGAVLVAAAVDPGWISLFPLATAVLSEHGGPLSHAAILARELGVPTVVGIPGLLTSVRDGDLVEVDGEAGTVTVLDATHDGTER